MDLSKLQFREHVVFTDPTPQVVNTLAKSDIHRVYLGFTQAQSGVVTTVGTRSDLTLNDGLFLGNATLYELFRERSGLLCSQQWYCQSTGGTVPITVYEAWDYAEPIIISAQPPPRIILGTDAPISRQMPDMAESRAAYLKRLIDTTMQGAVNGRA